MKLLRCQVGNGESIWLCARFLINGDADPYQHRIVLALKRALNHPRPNLLKCHSIFGV